MGQVLSSCQHLLSASTTLPPLQTSVPFEALPDDVDSLQAYQVRSEQSTAFERKTDHALADYSQSTNCRREPVDKITWTKDKRNADIPSRSTPSPITQSSITEHQNESHQHLGMRVGALSKYDERSALGNTSIVSSERDSTLPLALSPSSKRFMKSNGNPVYRLRATLAHPFPCRYCGDGFATREDRKEHVDEYHPRPHKCSVCLHQFSRKFDLEKHVLTVHERLRPFKCDKCRSSFGQKHHLMRHLNSVHFKAKMHKCARCSSKFTRKEHLENHSRSVHKCFVYLCSLCDRGGNDRAWIVQHLEKLHAVKTSKVMALVAAANNCEDSESSS
ncbi:unnamed protein product [Agarophyton chilense]